MKAIFAPTKKILYLFKNSKKFRNILEINFLSLGNFNSKGIIKGKSISNDYKKMAVDPIKNIFNEIYALKNIGSFNKHLILYTPLLKTTNKLIENNILSNNILIIEKYEKIANDMQKKYKNVINYELSKLIHNIKINEENMGIIDSVYADTFGDFQYLNFIRNLNDIKNKQKNNIFLMLNVSCKSYKTFIYDILMIVSELNLEIILFDIISFDKSIVKEFKIFENKFINYVLWTIAKRRKIMNICMLKI